MTPAPFKVRSEQKDDVFVILIEGELDMNTATELERQLEAPLSAPGSTLLLDLSRCEFIDSTGISLIVRAWQALDDRFSICGAGDQVKRVLDVTGLDSTIPTHRSRDDALTRLRG